MHYEVITQKQDGFEFSPPLTLPEAQHFAKVMHEQKYHAFVGRVYEMQDLVEMGCTGRGYAEI